MKKSIKLLFAIILVGIFIITAPGYYPQIADMKNIWSLMLKTIESL